MTFDPTMAAARVARLWSLEASFGMERSAYNTYLNDLVSDRYALINGMHVLRDELQFAFVNERSDVSACAADLSLPTVVTTLAHTNCGDRIHQGEATISYVHTVAQRFATMSEIGELKLESFNPTGGGTDDGPTLAHVTVAHQLDASARKRIYEGNPYSFVLVAVDLKTHVGRLDDEEGMHYGLTKESPWRDARAACGAIVGTLGNYNADNAVHRRIRSDLGEENYAFLSREKVFAATPDGGRVEVTAAVAAAIVAVQGMRNTAQALTTELDERGVGHLTASVTVNVTSRNDTVLYLGRSTVFDGTVTEQGLGTDATKYAARVIEHDGHSRLLLTYDGHTRTGYPVEQRRYTVRQSNH